MLSLTDRQMNMICITLGSCANLPNLHMNAPAG